MNDTRWICELALKALEGDESVKAAAILACQQHLECHPPLHRAIYRSRSLMSQDGLNAMLEHARASNHQIGVTGVLVHHKEEFIQIVEGPTSTVVGLVGTIRNDPRHDRFALLAAREVSSRKFGDWWMADLAIDADDFSALAENFAGGDWLERKISQWMTAP
ncbi:MAG: BLUF domain-containing protein [Betaproteobacteria bacterium]|nr:BLUF domain-containing protein [Betaproteobacteria bacterium]